MNDDTTNSPTAPRPVWLKRGLILSLVANLLLAGLLAGAFARNHLGKMRGGGDTVGFGTLAMALSREDRAALRDRFMGKGQGWNDFRAANDKDFADLARIIATEPFDREAAAAVLDRQSAAFSERMSAGRTLLLDRIAGMSPTDRAAFAERLRTVLHRRD